MKVDVRQEDSRIFLSVEDDGKGFDQARAQSEIKLGLVGMRERMHLIGGSMTVESSPGHGTTISVSVPLPAVTPVPVPAVVVDAAGYR